MNILNSEYIRSIVFGNLILSQVCLVHGDIFQWEYVNPADPNQGTQPSAIVAPDGVGVNAEPGAQLANRNLTKAYLVEAILSSREVYDSDGFLAYRIPTDLSGANLSQADLTGAYLDDANLANVNLRQANLTNTRFGHSTLTGADFSDAEVRGADFGAELSADQLYSTRSYQDHDLSGIHVIGQNMAGLQLGGQKLTNAAFFASIFTGANLSGVDARDGEFGGKLNLANFTQANLANANLRGELTDANFTEANLSNADFTNVILTGADFSGANIHGANFFRDHYTVPASTGITAAQLSSTASYQAHDLRGIKLGNNNLAGIDLSNQNLTDVSFAAQWDCDENGCIDYPGTDLTSANLSGSDARNANFQSATMTGVNTTNLIGSHGHITGLDLTAGQTLVIRDYDGDSEAIPPKPTWPIFVEQHLTTDATSKLQIVFDADAWDSTISFSPGIPVTRSGTLELTFALDVDPATQIGRTFDVFDWTGVSPTGAFTVESPYAWDLTQLYTTGEVTLTAISGLLPGDFDGDGDIDGRDFLVWQRNPGIGELADWQANFGNGSLTAESIAIPEPSGVLLAVFGMMFAAKRSVCGWTSTRPQI